MPRSASKPNAAPSKKAVSNAKLRRLRAQATRVRAQVERDREQIAAEGRQAVDDAVRDGKLTKLTVVLRADEQNVLDALDRYGAEHGLKSRSQVVRVALSQLLNVALDKPHWGWPAGQRRQ